MQLKNIIFATVKHLPLLTKVLLMLVTSALIPLMFPSDGQGEHYDYAEGSIWRNDDLVAPFDFSVQKTPSEIEQQTAAAKAELTLYYHYDPTAYGRAVEQLNTLARHRDGLNLKQLRRTVDSIYSIGYVETPEDMPDFENHTLILLDGNIGSEHTANEYVTAVDVASHLLRDSVLVPSIVYDANRTRVELDSRISQMVTSTGMVKQGQRIVAKGETVTPVTARIIASLEQENDKLFRDNYHPWGRYAGQLILCIISFVALYMFLKNTRHSILEDNRKVTFVMVLVLLASAATALVSSQRPELVLIVPLCIVPIMVRIFFDMRVALYVHIITIIILANMVPNPFEFIFYQLIAGMMSIVTVRNFESRSKFFVVSGVIFLSYALIYTFGVLSQESTLDGITLDRYLVFFLNALLTLLAYPLIFVFERMFGLTTNLTLMELSSTNTPALRELSRNAPGTFQHSMQVANISEDLINEIGGNALLAKVGALYHDIGKVAAPLYFTENQNGGFNPHDELEYRESAAIIIQHVRSGLELAKKYHLPSAVQDFIRTHHGTTMTGYFYAKQRNEHPDEPIDAADFQYPGPTPFSRETAVVMIVDSVEAACKSLKNPDNEAIGRLVDQIVDSKISQNQLQNCDLTFGDISRVRNMLKTKMLSIYHARISYPVVNSQTTNRK
ncbi:MAG: HDIG domain-containing protein [Bacteroidales bacterium]|nr:HDIG domain-containing protein [Bacteroidales bacterium]